MQIIVQDPVSALNTLRMVAQSIDKPLVNHKRPKDEVAGRVDEVMSLVSLNPDRHNRTPSLLSGGQRHTGMSTRAGP